MTRCPALRRILFASLLFTAPMALFPSPAAAFPTREPAADEKATKDDYELQTNKTASSVKVGSSAPFSLVIVPKNGKKVHPDAPLEVTLKPQKGLKPQKNKLGRNDLVDKAATSPEVRTTVVGESAGASVLEARVSFLLCTDAWCQRMTDRVSVPITVEK